MSVNVKNAYNFLDYCTDKGFLNKNTVVARKTACNALFSILDDSQQSVEYISKNLASIATRYERKNPHKYTARSLEVYKSRARQTIDDFSNWNLDKTKWEDSKTSIKTTRQRKINRNNTRGASSNKQKINQSSNQENQPRTLSLPVSQKTTIKVELPIEGITIDELRKLGLFLFPYCKDFTNDKANEWPLATV